MKRFCRWLAVTEVHSKTRRGLELSNKLPPHLHSPTHSRPYESFYIRTLTMVDPELGRRGRIWAISFPIYFTSFLRDFSLASITQTSFKCHRNHFAYFKDSLLSRPQKCLQSSRNIKPPPWPPNRKQHLKGISLVRGDSCAGTLFEISIEE